MDTPLVLLSWFDDQLARVLPMLLRIVVWAALAAFASMEIYRMLSPQERIRGVEEAMRRARARLEAHEGSFDEGWSLVRETLRLSMKRLALVAPAAVAATLPLFALMWWMSQTYEGADVLGVGPAWVAGWQLTFFVALSASAFAAKALRGIA